MANILEESAKSLLIKMNFNNTLLATGTAFITESSKGPVLITNRHNVTGRDQDTNQPISPTGAIPDKIVIAHNQSNKLGTWVDKTESLYDKNNNPLWFEHPVLKDKADLIALKLTQTDAVHIYSYDPSKPGDDIQVGPSDTISVIGFPFGLTAGGSLPIWSTGFIASEPDINYKNLPIFLIDCRSRPGQSGSPVIAYISSGVARDSNGNMNHHGRAIQRFLGIYSGRINKESDLGIVWKASSIKQLIESI